MERYYLVPKGTESYRTIAKFFADRKTAINRRLEFVKRHLDLGDATEIQLVNWGEYRWAVIPPKGFVVPTDWKKTGRMNESIEPRRTTKAQRVMHEEMNSDEMMLPEGSTLANRLGVESRLESVDGGVSLFHVGIEIPKSGVYVIKLHPNQMPPADCERISDIEFEKLKSKKRKAVTE